MCSVPRLSGPGCRAAIGLDAGRLHLFVMIALRSLSESLGEGACTQRQKVVHSGFLDRSCQGTLWSTSRSSKTRARGADYLLCVKGNQPKLRQALEEAFADAPETSAFEQTERAHGRRIARHAEVIADTGLVDTQLWPDCCTLGRILSLRAEGEKTPQLETRYTISSAAPSSEQLVRAVR